MNIAAERRLSVFMDHSALDHIYRIQLGTYNGANGAALTRIREAAEAGAIDLWIADITEVEMIHGREKVKGGEKEEAARSHDERKRILAENMRVKWLGYPCSKLSDNYSRLDTSLWLSGPESGPADLLERELEQVHGVSTGDARQLVCAAYPFDANDPEQHPRIDAVLAEDAPLIRAVRGEISKGKLVPLKQLFFGAASDLVKEFSGALE